MLNGPMIQPVFVVAAIAFDLPYLPLLTRRYIALKRQFFPGLMPRTNHELDAILGEIKGAELRRDIAERSRAHRRTAIGFLDKVCGLLEIYDVSLFGRVWIKGINVPIDGDAIYTFSVQAVCADFQRYLQSHNDTGLVIADSRTKSKNQRVSHSIFTQKFRAAGDAYGRVIEMPTFGHSDNHAGLQIADLLCSAFLVPLAIHGYCQGGPPNQHVRPGYAGIKQRYGERLLLRQYRHFTDARWRGGVTVSDNLQHRSGALLFR